jgi:tetratricopeptide (TPR) repeat protein
MATIAWRGDRTEVQARPLPTHLRRTRSCVLVAALALPALCGAQQAWDRDAVFAAREAQLKQAIASRPSEAQPLAELAAFYLRPVAPREIEAADGVRRRVLVPLRNEWIVEGIKQTFAVPWVFRGDPDRARPLLARALELQPGHPLAVRESAMMHRMKIDLDRMRPFMEAALRRDPMDLDMCRLYLDHRTAGARTLNDLAAGLRQPVITEEERSDGRYRITRSPSAADYARANEYDRQAQAARREAIIPLNRLAAALKNDPQRAGDPVKEAKWHLASAVYRQWIGELEKSAGSASLALRADPTNLDALDFLVDITRGTRTRDRYAEYKAILDRWSGADSTAIRTAGRRMGPRR